MIALLPGTGCHRITARQHRAHAEKLQKRLDKALAEIRKAESFIDQLCAVNREATAELRQMETVARHHQSVALQRAHIIDDLSNQLVTAEMRIRELERDRDAAWARHANEDTVTVPAPADDPQSAWFDGGDTTETTAPVPLWDAPQAAVPAAGPVVHVVPYRDPATDTAAHTHNAA